MTVNVRVISSEDVRNLASMGSFIDFVEEGFKQYALKNSIAPPRTIVRLENIRDDEARATGFVVSSSFVGGDVDAFGTKILGGNAENPVKRNLPRSLGLVILNNVYSGAPIAIIEASSFTAIRTAACAALSAKHIARENAETAAIFGAGAIGRELVRAFKAIRDIKAIRMIDPPAPDKCKAVCEEASKELGIEAVPVDNPKEAVMDADIVGTATKRPHPDCLEPLFKGEWLKNGAHVVSVGCQSGRAREIDDTTIERSRKPITVDSLETIKDEGGRDIVEPLRDGLISEEEIVEIGNVILGKVAGRTGEEEITFFKTCGVAVEDAATARALYELARTRNVGNVVRL
jgi:ornithine cyclodeaminase/alanine dehydrogenase-like protein (mu-crystallin family)